MRMNFKFSCLIFSFFLIVSSKNFGQDCKASLTVRTDKAVSEIYLNNKLIGKGKITTELSKGRYFLKVIEESDKWDAKSYKDTLLVNNCNEINLTYNFNSVVYLKTNPQDAYVYNNDTLVGYTPLFLSKKYQNILLTKPGYNSKEISLNELQSNQTINLNFLGEEQGRSFYEKPIFKILVAGIVVLGGTTAYFKLKADDKFDKYQSTGDNNFLDQTRKYDLISGITMGALQVNFGVLLYYFLTD